MTNYINALLYNGSLSCEKYISPVMKSDAGQDQYVNGFGTPAVGHLTDPQGLMRECLPV